MMFGHKQQNLEGFLARLTSRSILSDEEQQAILSLPGEVAQVQANRDFVRPDEVVDHSCLVVAGLVGRFGDDREGARQITAFYVAGDMADLNSVVQPKATWALQALSAVTIVRVPHAAIRRVAARYPAIAEALWRDCVADASILAEWVVNVGRRNAKVRLAHLFCEMAVRSHAEARDATVTFDLPATQAQLADATAMTPIHVNRTLKALQRDGLLRASRQAITIFNWDELARIGDFDAAYLHIDIAPEERIRITD